VNVVPSPSWHLAVIAPPWASTIQRQMLRAPVGTESATCRARFGRSCSHRTVAETHGVKTGAGCSSGRVTAKGQERRDLHPQPPPRTTRLGWGIGPLRRRTSATRKQVRCHRSSARPGQGSHPSAGRPSTVLVAPRLADRMSGVSARSSSQGRRPGNETGCSSRRPAGTLADGDVREAEDRHLPGRPDGRPGRRTGHESAGPTLSTITAPSLSWPRLGRSSSS
jgi:hypothetical protein